MSDAANHNPLCLHSCCSEANITEFRNSWVIRSFPYCDADSLESLRFANDGARMIWHYQMQPRTYDETGAHFVKLDFVVDACEKPRRLVLKMVAHNSRKERKTHECRIDAVEGRSATLLCCSRREDRFFDSDELTLDFEILLVEEFQCHEVRARIAKQPSQLVPEFTRLLEGQAFWDVTIVVGNDDQEQFRGHKAILAARSTVFAAMFTHGMVESQQNRVVIADIEPTVFKELLRYIYTDAVGQDALDSMPLKLLQVADKYDLSLLKNMCERTLLAKLDEHTAIRTLIAADRFRAEKLKRATVCFIARNSAVMKTEEWKSLWEEHFALANEAVGDILRLKQ